LANKIVESSAKSIPVVNQKSDAQLKKEQGGIE
jgi:hypothetical protein